MKLAGESRIIYPPMKVVRKANGEIFHVTGYNAKLVTAFKDGKSTRYHLARKVFEAAFEYPRANAK